MSYHAKDHTIPKECKTCGQLKEPSEFYLVRRPEERSHLPPAREAHCIPCRNRKVSEKKKEKGEEWKSVERARKKRWAEANYERYSRTLKNARLKREYGITVEDYDVKLSEQSGVCAICGKKETKTSKNHRKPRDLAVDHCHETGKVRGLLCFSCNGSIGKFEDSIDLLQKAVSYLKRYSK